MSFWQTIFRWIFNCNSFLIICTKIKTQKNYREQKKLHNSTTQFNKFTKKIMRNFRKYKFYAKMNKVDRFKFNYIFNKIKNKYLLSESNLENISFVIKIAHNYKIK